MRRIFAKWILALTVATVALHATAEISAQLRAQVSRQAQSLSLGASALVDELQATGFLDDPKTQGIVKRAAPAHALAWAALQAEQAQPGMAVQLLQSVAQSIAAHQADAIRYEPAFRQHFSQFPAAKPVPSPKQRKFKFDRTVKPLPDVAFRLPAPAQQLLEPISKYSGVYPGGMHGMMVDVLRLHPTVAMDIERSSADAAHALVAGIERAPIPPTHEQHVRDVVAALLLHGGEAIRHEDVVKRFGEKRGGSKVGSELIVKREAAPSVISAATDQDHDAIVSLAHAMVKDLWNGQDNSDVSNGEGQSGSGGSAGSGGGGPSMERKPSFETTSRQLHSEGVRPGPSMRSFSAMRSMGGGRGGGGVVIGSSIQSAIAPKPVALSFRTVAGSDRVVPVVALSDGRILFAPPVRRDIFLAACRIGFGDKSRKIERLPTTGATGSVLISFLVQNDYPVKLAEFLVHPAIADLPIGRDLIVVDGASFLFLDALDQRLKSHTSTKFSNNESTMTPVQWHAALKAGEFGDWYRYVERSILIDAIDDRIQVKAKSGGNKEILFEFVRPAGTLVEGKPSSERAVVIEGAPKALGEFGALNDLIRTAAITRWAASEGGRWIGGSPKMEFLGEVRSVVFDKHRNPTFDTRGAVDLELHAFRQLLRATMADVPQSRRVDAQKLGEALLRALHFKLLFLEMRSRGYSVPASINVVAGAIGQYGPERNEDVRSVLVSILKHSMPIEEFLQMKGVLDRCKGKSICVGNSRLNRNLEKYEPWALHILSKMKLY